jgi:hypothetical protein
MSKKMKQLFSFDVRLQDLMNLEKYSQKVDKLSLIFDLLKGFWYTLKDKTAEQERWNNIRIGSVDVYLDETNSLHLDFTTRFSFNSSPEMLKFFEYISD